MTPPLEDEEQATFVQWLRIRKIDHFSIPNSNAMSSLSPKMAMIVMSKLKKTGFATGASDIVVLLDNKILFIEMKRAKKSLSKVSEEQKKFLDMVNTKSYCEGHVCYGAKDAIKYVESML